MTEACKVIGTALKFLREKMRQNILKAEDLVTYANSEEQKGLEETIKRLSRMLDYIQFYTPYG